MKRWTSRWAAMALGAALVAAPVASGAQTPAPAGGATAAQSAPASQSTPRAELAKAENALSRISSTAVTGEAQARIGELRSHVANLQKAIDTSAAASAKAETGWSSEVAQIERIVSGLLAESPSTTAPARPTGTAGTVTGNPAEAAIALDAETRARLMEVRNAVTAFAAAMNRTSTPQASATSTPAPAASATPAAPASPATSAASPGSAPAATQPPDSAQASQPATANVPGAVDAEGSKRALSAARDTLADLTKLPAAAQLAGESRTQVQQLISNFNDLITANSNWRAAYAKVDANLTALIGAQSADESPSTPAAGNAGAVGTSGTATASLDPAIEAKLVEFRTHLKEFERAAGGASATAAAPSAAETTAMAPASTTPAADTAAAPAATTGSAASTSPTTTTNTNDAAKGHVDAIEQILNSGGSSLTAAQIAELKTHVAELKRLLDGSR